MRLVWHWSHVLTVAGNNRHCLLLYDYSFYGFVADWSDHSFAGGMAKP